MMRARRVLRWVLTTFAVLLLAFFALVPAGRYVLHAAWAEGRILARRRSIEQILEDSTVSARTRGKLSLVLDARRFAVDSLGLRAGQSFTTFSRVDRDTLVLVLSAAYRDKLRFRTWWFPIVGSVPYKGYFDFRDALDAARDLERHGFDSYVRPASAFSTLGFFNDPLLSTTLHEDSASLANTVMHELTHNTFWAPGQTVFNESFANFVGSRGAEWFYVVRGDSANLTLATNDWERDKIMGRFWDRLYRALDSAFAADSASEQARLVARDAIFAHARVFFADSVRPVLPGVAPGTDVRLRLDNAIILSRRVYRTGLDDFDAVYAREGNDLRRAMARIIALAKENPDDPYAAMRAWLGSAHAESAAQ